MTDQPTGIDPIPLYRQQIRYLRAELERQALMVAKHYNPDDRIHFAHTEWRVVNSAGTPHTPTFDTMTDAQTWMDNADQHGQHGPHHLEYRTTTAWRTAR